MGNLKGSSRCPKGGLIKFPQRTAPRFGKPIKWSDRRIWWTPCPKVSVHNTYPKVLLPAKLRKWKSRVRLGSHEEISWWNTGVQPMFRGRSCWGSGKCTKIEKLVGIASQLELEYKQGIPQLRGMVPNHVRSNHLLYWAVIKTLLVWSCLLYIRCYTNQLYRILTQPPVSESLSNYHDVPVPLPKFQETYIPQKLTSREVAKVKIKGPVGFAWQNFHVEYSRCSEAKLLSGSGNMWPWRMGLHLGSGWLGPRNQLELEYNQGIPQLRGMVPKHVRSNHLPNEQWSQPCLFAVYRVLY